MSDPKIILMDEPFQGLDIMSTKDLQETITNLQKIKNFDYKVKQIEGKLNKLSQSLADSGSNSVNERRQKMFNEITDVKKKFTPLEKFLYYDGQSNSTGSCLLYTSPSPRD